MLSIYQVSNILEEKKKCDYPDDVLLGESMLDSADPLATLLDGL